MSCSQFNPWPGGWGSLSNCHSEWWSTHTRIPQELESCLCHWCLSVMAVGLQTCAKGGFYIRAVAFSGPLSLCWTHQGPLEEIKRDSSHSYLRWATHSSPELIRTDSHFYSSPSWCPLALSDTLQVYVSSLGDPAPRCQADSLTPPVAASMGQCWFHRQTHPVVLWAGVTGEPPVASNLIMWPSSPTLWQSHSFCLVFFHAMFLPSLPSISVLTSDTDICCPFNW